MFWEGLRAMMRVRRGGAVTTRCPAAMADPRIAAEDAPKRSKIYSSIILVIVVGLVIGLHRRGDGHRRLHPGAADDLLAAVPTSTVIGTFRWC